MSFRMISFAPREAITTAAAAGAVTIICNQHLVSSLNPFGNCRPGGEAFWCVLCILWTVLWLKIRVHSCPFVVLLQQVTWIDIRIDDDVFRLFAHDDHRSQQP